jgi:hypothetical protein
MTEHFTFPTTEAGLTLALETTLSLRRAGFRTRTVERVLHGFEVVTVLATLRPRPRTAFQNLNATLNRGAR